MRYFVWFTPLFLLLAACGLRHQDELSITIEHINEHYWYEGLADISIYRLEELKYGEPRTGFAVSVLVTEDFDPGRGLKTETQEQTEHVKVLKQMHIKRFVTGIYDYSLMTTSFTGFHNGRAYKTSHSSQDWCGQSYVQQNYQRSGHDIRQFNYFEQVGERHMRTEAFLMEDHLPGMLVLDPAALPFDSTLMIIPSLEFLNAAQMEIAAWPATISKHEGEIFTMDDDTPMSATRISILYDRFPRQIDLYFTAGNTPILAARNEYDLSNNQPQRVSSQRLHRFKRIDYWNLNTVLDEALRDEMFMGIWQNTN